MRWYLRITCLLSMLLIVANVVFAADKLADKLVVENPVYNFGTVAAGKKVDTSFVVRNISDKAIEIIEIRPDCGCTSSVVDTKTIEKGQEARVDVSFNTTGFSGFKSKVVRVYVDDPIIGYFLLRIEGNVVSDFTVEPGRIYFSEVKKGQETPEQVVTILSNLDKPTILQEVLSDDPAVTTETLLAEGKELKLKVKLQEPLTVGLLRTNVKALVAIGEKDVRVLVIPLVANIKGDYETTPSEVSFGLVRQQDVGKQEAEVIIAFPRPIDQRSSIEVKASNDHIVAEVSETRENAVIIKVKLADSALGNIRGQAIVELEDGDAKRTIAIPVYAIVGKQGE